MRRSRIFPLLLFLLSLIVLVLLISFAEAWLREIAENTFKMEALFFFLTVKYLPLGILLGLPHLWRQMKRQGIWKTDWWKLAILGVPSLFLSLYPYLYFAVPFFQLAGRWSLYLLQYGHQIGSLLLGYFLMTSFSKSGEPKMGP